ncbi:MAG: hypothetical protein AABX16_02260 [Nanoarchaeota archaeon]
MEKIVFILAVLIVLTGIGYIFLNQNTKESLQNIQDSINPEITVIELAADKERYKDTAVIIKDAYVPSEAFILVKTANKEEKIFLDPPNKTYCRNFRLKGMLRKDAQKDQWNFVITESTCLKN